MNYKESALILKEIKKAKRILLNCHRGPDADSLGSALALYIVLRGMGKDVSIIYPRKSGLPSNLKFLPNFEKITPVDYANYDFSKHDLFVVTDSSSWDMVSNGKEIPIPKIPLIVIDHHLSNTRFGNINLVDSKVTSVGEFLYWIMTDWDVQVDKDIATCLLTGIIGDTGAFRFPGTGARTLEVAGKLMAKGADKEKIVFNIYSFSFGMIKFWAEALKKAKIDKIGKFLWMAIPHEKYVELGSLADAKEWTATQFDSKSK
jgi:phosphoesterase RecJ-like protein